MCYLGDGIADGSRIWAWELWTWGRSETEQARSCPLIFKSQKDSGKVSEKNQRSQEALESQHPALSVPLPYWSSAQVFRQEVEEEARSLTTELLRTHNLMGRSELYPGTQWDTRHTHNH